MKGVIKSELKQIAIGQAIMQANRPYSILTPILFGLSVELDYEFGSKFLVTELARLGFCLFCDEVIRFKHSIVASSSPDSASDADIAAMFTQWIADNVDHNVRTIDGYGTFRGIIATSVYNHTHTFSHTYPVVRLKKRLTASEIIKNRGIEVVPYVQSVKSGLQPIKLTDMLKLQTRPVLPPVCKLNLLWYVAYFRQSSVLRPN
jgi:hypothetical protein